MEILKTFEEFEFGGGLPGYGVEPSLSDLFTSKKGLVPIKFNYYKNGQKYDEATLWFEIERVEKFAPYQFRFHVANHTPEYSLEMDLDYNMKGGEINFYSLRKDGKILDNETIYSKDKDTIKYLEKYLIKSRIEKRIK